MQLVALDKAKDSDIIGENVTAWGIQDQGHSVKYSNPTFKIEVRKHFCIKGNRGLDRTFMKASLL